MDAAKAKVRILLIRPWTEPIAPLRAVLRSSGFTAQIFRVDLEPALNAALERNGFDVVIFDPSTANMTLQMVEARVCEHRKITPVMLLPDLDVLATQLQILLASRIN